MVLLGSSPGRELIVDRFSPRAITAFLASTSGHPSFRTCYSSQDTILASHHSPHLAGQTQIASCRTWGAFEMVCA